MKKHLAKAAKKHKSTKRKATIQTPAEQFSKLWAQVQKERESIAKALEQQQAIVEQYTREVLPQEIASFQQLYAETEQLLSFLPKKSLTNYQRGELLDWITDNLRMLQSFPFDFERDLPGLVLQFKAVCEEVFGPIFDEPDADIFDEMDELDEDFEADLFGFEEAQSKNEDATAFDQSEDYDPFGAADSGGFDPYASQKKAAEELFSASAANKMFRQLAKILHPDLEQDETQKDIKHQHMTQLLKAREEQDVLTIFELFCTHAGKGLPSFDAAELTKLCDLLKRQIRTIQREKHAALAANPVHGVIYEQYYHKNPQHTFIALKNRLESLRSEMRESQILMKDLTTLRGLKAVLKERQQDFYY